MPFELRCAQRRIRVDLRRVKQVAEKLLEGVQREKMVLSVLLTDDQEMAALHERWMGDPSPTDVLSFPAQERGRSIWGHSGLLKNQSVPKWSVPPFRRTPNQ